MSGIALLTACSGGDDGSGDPAACTPGTAACGAAAVSGAAGATGGIGGTGALAGSSGGAAGMQPSAGIGGAIAIAGASAAGASGTVGASGSSGGAADAGPEQDGSGPDAGESDAGMDAGAGDDAAVPPPYTPLYRIPVRIHAGDSALTDAQFMAVTAEVNDIWRLQAGVCFEFELVDHDDLGPGLDIRYGPGSSSDPNGYYSNDNDIFSRDQPSLGAAPNPVQLPTARTTAHEFGHALGLPHQDFENSCPDGTGDLDCNDLLMRSGRRGFFLSEPEIERARSRAEDKALDDTTPLDCAPLVIAR